MGGHNVLQVTINVDEKTFNLILNDTISEIPKETLQEIVVKTFAECLTKSKKLEKLLIKTDSYDNGKGGFFVSPPMPTEFLKDLISKSAPSSVLDDMYSIVLEHIKANLPEYAIAAISEIMVGGILSCLVSDKDILEKIFSKDLYQNMKGE